MSESTLKQSDAFEAMVDAVAESIAKSKRAWSAWHERKQHDDFSPYEKQMYRRDAICAIACLRKLGYLRDGATDGR